MLYISSVTNHLSTSNMNPLFFLLCLVSVLLPAYASGDGNRTIRCIERERQALLTFKRGLDDPDNLLASWRGEECCKWRGIKCSNRTGQVIALQLKSEEYGSDLSGKLSPALTELRQLNILDLSFNSFYEKIPGFIGSFKKLKHLHLKHCSFYGVAPDQLGNLTNLQTLDLGDFVAEGIEFRKLDWLPRLSSLIRLDLSGSNLSDPHAMQQIMNLASLQELNLAHSTIFPNTSSIDLLVNSSFKSLSILNLRGTGLTSPALIPRLINASTNMVSLDLSDNNIGGPLPEAFGNLIFLKDLDLSYNMLKGEIPNSFWKLSNLEIIDLSYNSFEGTIFETHLSKLNNLKMLNLSFNSLSIVTESDWIPPFRLDTLRLARCNMGPNFPKWILTQHNLSQLDLSSAGIHDSVPTEFWDLSPWFRLLNLSDNQISGRVRNLSSDMVDISSNNFSGPLPFIHPDTFTLQISNNSFQGPISRICTNTYNQLRLLDFSDNQFTGEIPDCWSNMNSLSILSLANNNFSGKIPSSLGSDSLEYLYLSRNNLVGELPSTLRNSVLLDMMDVGENKIEGNIPSWIGTHLTSLTVLSLRHNEFNGSIPSNICHLNNIQILDLSSNRISGIIPQCFNNFTYMVEKNLTGGETLGFGFGDDEDDDRESNTHQFTEHALVQWKRQDFEFKSLELLRLIDLSSNRLTGSIPRETFLLKALISLNLTRNYLDGRIDPEIGQMEMLEVLDLSNNQISGDIPTGLGSLNYLAVLDLSNNSLSGRIPPGTQLEGFNASVYVGNSELCGHPLMPCLGDSPPVPRVTAHEEPGNHNEVDDIVTREFYISLAIGFIIALWGTIVTLLLKVSWRAAYFNFMYKIGDRIYFTHHKIRR